MMTDSHLTTTDVAEPCRTRPPAIVQADLSHHSAPENTDAGDAPMGMAPVQRRDTAGAGRGRRAAQVLGVGTLGAQGVIYLTHPWIGVILTAAEVTVPLIGALVLLVVILCGSDKTCDRAFRLLRWAVDRPEPATPGDTTPSSGSGVFT
jgi:hypothetical protein